MAALELTQEVWEHGLLSFPAGDVTEQKLLHSLERLSKSLPSDLHLSFDRWTLLAESELNLSRRQAAACMRLTFILSSAGVRTKPLPRDEELRVPLGSMLLLLWVQHAAQELGSMSACIPSRAQGADDSWPSPTSPPLGSPLGSSLEPSPSPRTLAVSARLGQLQHRGVAAVGAQRRKLIHDSLLVLLRLVGAGAERLYASEFDRLSLLLRPEAVGAQRRAARKLPPLSLSAALGLWEANAHAALPLSALCSALNSALLLMPTVSAAEAVASSFRLLETPLLSLDLATAFVASRDDAAAASANEHAVGAADVPPQRPAKISVPDVDEAHCSTATLQRAQPLAIGDRGLVRLVHANRRTIVLTSSETQLFSLQILDCHSCYLYILAPVRSVELVGCRACTVVVGAVQCVLSVHFCERLCLHATAAAVRVGNCIDSTLHLCTNAPPLFWGENCRLVLAPFVSVYDGLREHMEAAQVSPELSRNAWSAPCCFSGGALHALSKPHKPGAAGESCAPVAGCSLLPPSKLAPFHVPFCVPAEAEGGEGVPPVCELPTEYADALVLCLRKLDAFQMQLASLRESELVGVQQALHAKFKEWLVRSGNMRQLHDLMATQPPM